MGCENGYILYEMCATNTIAKSPTRVTGLWKRIHPIWDKYNEYNHKITYRSDLAVKTGTSYMGCVQRIQSQNHLPEWLGCENGYILYEMYATNTITKSLTRVTGLWKRIHPIWDVCNEYDHKITYRSDWAVKTDTTYMRCVQRIRSQNHFPEWLDCENGYILYGMCATNTITKSLAEVTGLWKRVHPIWYVCNGYNHKITFRSDWVHPIGDVCNGHNHKITCRSDWAVKTGTSYMRCVQRIQSQNHLPEWLGTSYRGCVQRTQSQNHLPEWLGCENGYILFWMRAMNEITFYNLHFGN